MAEEQVRKTGFEIAQKLDQEKTAWERLMPEKGGVIKLRCPFGGSDFSSNFEYEKIPGGYSFNTTPGDEIILTAKAR